MISSKKRRQNRSRYHLKHANRVAQLPRLTVFLSGRHVYAQLIDDSQGSTLASASTLDKACDLCRSTRAADWVGKNLAEKAKAIKVQKIIFDRGPYLYHGSVKKLADAARENGLIF